MDTEVQKNYLLYRNMYYLLFFLISYVFPFTYFFIKLGITKQSTTIVLPVVIIGVLGVMKLAGDIPDWISTWQPSFKKGLVKAIPKLLLFITLITLGLTLRHILIHKIEVAFTSYFETVLVLFGGMAIGSIFEAYHLKYKELYLISKGYVLGVVNK